MKRILTIIISLICIYANSQTIARFPYYSILQTYWGDSLRTSFDTDTVKWTTNQNYYSIDKPLYIMGNLVGIHDNSQPAIECTYSELKALQSSSSLLVGRFYKIAYGLDYTSPTAGQYILMQALSTNEMAVHGSRMMLCPRQYYSGTDSDNNVWLGVWNSSLTPDVGELVVWGGKVFENLTGNVGTSLDFLLLDETNWLPIYAHEATNNQYIPLYFEITLRPWDWSSEYPPRVGLQRDGKNNILRYSSEVISVFYGIPFSDWNGYIGENNEALIIVNNTTSVLRNNKVTGMLAGNTSGVFGNNIFGSIYNNTCPGHIAGNTNKGDIANNSCIDILNNNNIGSISNNSNYVIYHNNNTGNITNNSNSGDIFNNNNLGAISNNSCIDILNNNNDGYIHNNSNTGNISNNNNNGIISDNNNLVDITNNKNNGRITDNHTIGNITENMNNGHIAGNTSSVVINIYKNTNNGDISSTNRTTDVFDTPVNK